MSIARAVHFTWNSPVPPREEGHEEDEEIDDDMEVNCSFILFKHGFKTNSAILYFIKFF